MNVKVFQRISICVILIFSVFVSPNSVSSANTYYFAIDSNNDTSDDDLTDNICADAQNDCTLMSTSISTSYLDQLRSNSMMICPHIPKPTSSTMIR